MPRMNQTGPQGQGPMTGRRMGRCADVAEDVKQPDLANQPVGENDQIPLGWGRRFGAGIRNCFGRGRCGRNSQPFNQGRGLGRGRRG